MERDKEKETRLLAVGATDTKEDFVTGCRGCYLVSDADCFVAFDENADTGSFLVKANAFYAFEDLQFTQIHAIRTGGATNLYILAKR